MTNRFFESPLLHALLIVIAGMTAYSNTFSVPFQFDDEDFIVSNPLIREFKNFTEPSRVRSLPLHVNVKFTAKSRLLSYVTFWFNYSLGKLNVAGYHVFNLVVHLLNGMFVYMLVLLTFKTPRLAESSRDYDGRYIALFSALIFVVHPIQTEAVTYITQRFTSLVALLYIAAVFFYAKWRQVQARRTKGAAIWYLLSLLMTLLAMKTKENAFTIPLAIGLYELVFFFGPFKKRIFPLVPFFATMLIVPLSLIGGAATFAEAADRASRTQWTPRAHYLFTEFGVVVMYLRLLFLPAGQNLDYDVPLQTSLFSVPVILPLVFLLGLFSSALYILRKSAAAGVELRVAAFGILWFFLTVIMESSIIPLYHVIYEHRAYLPSVGIITAFVSGIYWLSARRGATWSFRAATVALAVLSVISVSAAYSRNKVWRDEVSLWTDVISKSPAKSRGYYNLALAYAARGNDAAAIRYQKEAIRLQPADPRARANLAALLIAGGQWDEARDQLDVALHLNPGDAMLHNNLGLIHEAKGRFSEAIAEYEAAAGLNPGLAMAYYNLGVIYRKKGMNKKSEEFFLKADDIRQQQKID